MDDIERKNKNNPVKANPKERANCISSLLFCWMFPVFYQGLKKDFQDEDISNPPKKYQSGYLGKKLKKAWERELNVHEKPSFRRAFIKTFWLELLYYSSILWVQDAVVKMAQPLLVGKLLNYYDPNHPDITKNQAYIYAAGITLTSFSNVMTLHYSFYGLETLSLKMQVACRVLIYNKALKLSKTAMMESSVGQIVNLISNDLSRFQYVSMHLHQVFIAPVQTAIVLYLLFVTVDPAGTSGVAVLLLSTPLLWYMGTMTSKYRLKTAIKTDYRIKLMNEIISGIQVIKMYTWERPFAKLVELARKLEIKEIKSNAFIRSINLATSVFLIPVSIYVCILVYILTGNKLTAHFVYVVTPFYNTIRNAVTVHLPRCIASTAEANVSLKRIEKFLLSEEIEKKDKETTFKTTGITIKNTNVKWSKASSDFNLSNVNFTVGPEQLVAIVGRVGSGKSTLIQTILKEVTYIEGELRIDGSVSYAPQEPWLFSSSIRQNILFGQEIDMNKYKQVVQVCALEQDFLALPYGDRTIVGEKGIMLSGGQKARVSLARAVYKDADIYLLDDPLSAVDVKVGKQIFDDCITATSIRFICLRTAAFLQAGLIPSSEIRKEILLSF